MAARVSLPQTAAAKANDPTNPERTDHSERERGHRNAITHLTPACIINHQIDTPSHAAGDTLRYKLLGR